MKITGKTGEIIELKSLASGSCTIFRNPEPSSLTVLWFQEDNNEFIVDGKAYNFSSNQIAFFTEFHKIEIKKKGISNFLRFNRAFYCIIDHDDEVSCKGLLFFGASQLPVISVSETQKEHFQILWKMFQIEMNFKDNLQIEMLQMMLKRYLILCTRNFKKQHKLPQNKKENNLVREFNYLVEQYYNSKHTVAEYAELLHKSPKTISNTFSKIGTKTPLSYIQDRKMLEARRLLHNTDMQIQEIAYQVGFSDTQVFSRFFRNQEGISPSKYREKSLLGRIVNS